MRISLFLPVLACSSLAFIASCSKAVSTLSSDKNSPAVTTSTSTIPNGFKETLTQTLKQAGVDAKITDVIATNSPNLLWVRFDKMPPVYATADGKHLIQGDVLTLGNNQVSDMKDSFFAPMAKKMLADIPEKDMITFKPTGEIKSTVYVFTDVDCGYCRKLHQEINQINALGIQVHYLAWPRSEASVPVMESIWCSADRSQALTASKNGETIPTKTCDNPIAQQREIGFTLGVQGTPAVFSTDGKNIGGYMPANVMAQKLGIRQTANAPTPPVMLQR